MTLQPIFLIQQYNQLKEAYQRNEVAFKKEFD